MSSETINADDLLKVEMKALVQEKLRTGAYLAELEKLYHSSVELNDLPKRWSTNLTPNDEVSKKLETLRKRRSTWYYEMRNNIETPHHPSRDVGVARKLALSDPEKRKALSEEFVVLSESYDANLSKFQLIKNELTNIYQNSENEAIVLEMAICVNGNNTKIEFLENEIEKFKKK